MSAVLLFPFYWMLLTSLQPVGTFFVTDLEIFPRFDTWTTDAYMSIIRERPVLLWLFNSSIITLSTATLGVAISAPAGYSLSRFRERGQSLLGYTLLFSRTLPGTLLVIPIFITFSRIGLLNSLASVVAMNLVIIVPFSTWMMKSYFDSVPRDIEEAALVDGCTRWGALVRIILPISRPAVAATFAYASILSWSDFLFARTLLSDTAQWTVTVGIASFIGQYSVNWNGLMAIGLLSIIPLAILFFALEPFLVSGIGSGAVKG